MPELNLNIDKFIGDLIRLGPYYMGLIIFAFLCYVLQKHYERNDKPLSKYALLGAFCFAFVSRIFLAYYEDGSFDTAFFIKAAEITYLQDSVYRAPFLGYHFSYPPFYQYILLMCKYVSIIFALPMHFVVKLPAILTDIILPVVVLLIPVKTLHERQNITLILLFSPVLIASSSVLGQFDIIPILFAYLAVTILVKFRNNWQWAALCLGFGIYTKTFPILLLPAFLAEFSFIRKKLGFVCIAMAPIISSLLLLYFIEPEGISNILSHKGLIGGSWGFPGLFWVVGIIFDTIGSSLGYEAMAFIWNQYNSYGLNVYFIFMVISYFTLFKKISL